MEFLSWVEKLDVARAIATAVDIFIVAYVVYKAMQLIRGTRASSLVKGIIVLVGLYGVSRYLGLYTVYYLLQRVTTALLVALPIVFQPELRRALEQLGRGTLLGKGFAALGAEEVKSLVEEVAKACSSMSRERIGALIVIERDTGINEIIETGIRVDAVVTSELLINIFTPNTPLHDGAVVVRGNRIAAAGCLLPLTENPNVSKKLGTRHRAGLGVTEQSDAVAVIVSEESGVISIAMNGRLIRYLDEQGLTGKLEAMLGVRSTANSGLRIRLRG